MRNNELYRLEKLREKTLKHGMCNSREYSIWRGMKERCLNDKAIKYSNYGGRGIKVCERWNIFENFYSDMGKCPDEFQLDRIDNNGNYEPSNCRYINQSKNAANKNCYGKSGLKGVYKLPNGKYRSKIKMDNKVVHLGVFTCPIIAYSIYKFKHKEIWGL